jgi:acetyltransferase
MMEQTRIFTALKGVRGQEPVDLAALEQLIVRFSQLVVEQRWIKEIDINPLLASPKPTEADSPPSLLALDARVVLHGAEVGEDELPQPAIRPYPAQYVIPWTMKDGTPVTIRPIRPEDELMMVRFHETLSELSVYYRYFQSLQLSQRIAHERLTRMCFIDYDREMALVAERKNPETGEHEILGVGRLIKLPGTDKAEFALIISDRWQHQGLGTQFLRLLEQIGRNEKISRLIAPILPENFDMQRVCKKLGFRLRQGDGEVEAEIEL